MRVKRQVRDLQEQVDLYESAAQFGIYACSNSMQPNSRNASTMSSSSVMRSSTLSEAQALVSAAESTHSRSLDDSGTAAAREPEPEPGVSGNSPSAPPANVTLTPGTFGNTNAVANANANANSSLLLQSSPGPAPGVSNAHIRAEFERCLEAFRSKRMLVTKLQSEVCALKKELAESKKRLEKADSHSNELRVCWLLVMLIG